MLRNGAREKALSRKVMLSLLMAGTMSVCISGGDVWAKTVYVADGNKVEVIQSVSGDVIGGQFMNKDGYINLSDGSVTDVAALSMETLKQEQENNLNTNLIFIGVISSGDEIVGGSYNRSGAGTVRVAGTCIDFKGTTNGDITGGGKAASQKSINSSVANSNVLGNTVININGGTSDGLVVGGGSAKSNLSNTNTIANVGGNTVIHVNSGKLGGLVGGGYAYAYNSVNVQATARVEGTSAIVINDGQINKIKDTNVAKFNDAAIAGGGLSMSSATQTSAAKTYVDTANVTITGGTIAGNIYGGGLAIGAGSEAVTSTTNVTIKGGTINKQHIYGGGYAYQGGKAVTGNATVILNAADTGIDCIYGGGYANQGGKIETGNTHIVIDIAGNGKGAEDVFGGNSVYAFPGGTNAQGIVGDTLIEYKNGTSRGMIFGGSEIMGYTSATNDISKVENGNAKILVTGGTLTEAVLGGSKVRLTGDQENKISSTGKATTIIVDGDAASVKGLVGGDLVQVLNKTSDKQVRIAESSVENTNIIVNGGTVNTLYVDAGASIQIGAANFTGAIIGGGVATGGTDVDKHAQSKVDITDVVINAGIVNGDIYGGGLSTATLRGGTEADGGISTVGSASVTINGGTINGNVYGGGAAVGAANGTTTYSGGRSTVENVTVNITGGTITGNVYAGGYVSGNNSESKITGTATVNLFGGTINGVIDGNKDIIAGFAKLNVSNYQDSVNTIKNFDEIELSDSDFTGNLLISGSTVKTAGRVIMKGQLEVLSVSGQNKLLAQGEKFSVIQNAYGSPAVYLQTGSGAEENNSLCFNSQTTEISDKVEGYAAGIQVNSSSQVGGKSSNRMEFNGSAVKIDVNSDDSKATGLKISHSDNGGTLNTDIVFNSAVTEIRAHGNVSNEYYDQVAGIWEGEGSFKGDITTNVTFTGTANIEVSSNITGAYGVYLKGNGGTSTVDFQGDTNIQARNGQVPGTAVYVDGENRSVKLGSAGKTVSLFGDVIAKNEGEVVLRGGRNEIIGTLKADSGKIILQGASYTIDKFVTADSGKITISGGTLNIDDLTKANSEKFALENNSLIVEGKGVLQAASDNVFDKNGDSIAVKDDVDKKVLFNGGKLAVSDATYTLEQSKAYSTALKNMDKGTTTLTMTGVLNDNITNAGVEDLGNTGAVHTNISATCDNNELVVGNTSGIPGSSTNVNNDFGVKDLKLGDSKSETRVAVGGGNVLTLVGDGGSLITDKDGNEKTGKVEVNIAGGSLVLGSAAANSGGNLKAEVKVSDAASKLQVDAGTFNVEKITASQGEVNIGTGAALKSDKLNVGAVDTTAVANINGAAEIKELTASAGSTINVGNADSAGELKAQNVQLNGAQLFLDPVWQGNSTIGSASKAGLKFTGEIDGGLTVGQNSVLSLGTADTEAAENAFGRTGLSWGELAITAALYIDSAQELGSSGSIIVDGSLTHENNLVQSQTNKAYFAAGSLLMVKASAAEGAAGALKASDGTLDVANGAKLYIDSAEAGKTYTVASGFKVDNLVGWKNDNLLLNKLVKGEFKEENGTITITTIRSQSAVAMAGVLLPNILDAFTSDTESDFAGIKYLSNAISDLSSDEQALKAVNGFAQGAENSGASHSGTMAAFTIGDTVQDRMSLVNDAAALQGGKGRRADAGDNGSIWAQYIHNKDKVDNLGGASYDGQYNGVIIGSDFAPTGKYNSGVAFSYGDGSSSGSVSKNEFDFWGLSYYGSIKSDDTNVTFDAGYSRTSNSVKGAVAIESDTKVLTLGVKGEKLINNGHGTSYVPYAGLRYMNVDGGSYNGTIDGKVAAHYSADTANIWMLPLGIGVRNETITASGWKVRPMADIAYVWILGDKNSTMDVTVPGVNAADRLGYDIMDSGFFVGKLGIEAEKGDWTYGLGYAYQKGSHAQNSKFMLNVTYSF